MQLQQAIPSYLKLKMCDRVFYLGIEAYVSNQTCQYVVNKGARKTSPLYESFPEPICDLGKYSTNLFAWSSDIIVNWCELLLALTRLLD